MPLQLSGAYVMLGANRTTAAERAGLEAISYQSAWWTNPWGGGANLVWMLQVEIYRGAASGNATALAQGFSTMWGSVAVGNVSLNYEGVVGDSAYLFHGHQLLSSAYGAAWLQDCLDFWGVAAGTRFAMPPAREAVLARFIAEGDLELTFGSGWDFGTQGRGIDRPGLDFSWGLPAAAVRALAGRAGAAPWAAELDYFANALELATGVPGRTSSKTFWTSDFVAHHRPGWGATLKMQGNNTIWTAQANECDNSENYWGEYTGANVLNVYTHNEPSAVKDPFFSIFPLLDWHEFGGVTAEADTPIVQCGDATHGTWPITYTHFVGAASDGLYSAAGYRYASHNTSALKSTIFLDSCVVSIGTNLTNNYGSPTVPAPALVRTTLFSRLVPGAPAAFPLTVALADGSAPAAVPDGNRTWPGGAVRWLHAGGLGVWPAASAAGGVAAAAPSLRVALGNRSGDYTSIGSFKGAVEGRVWTASLEHGRALPAGGGAAAAAGYAFVLAPNVTAADMPALDSQPGGPAGAACVFGGAAVHGASGRASAAGAGGGDVAAAVFYADAGGVYPPCDAAAGGGGGLSADGAGMVVARRPAAGGVSVAAAHPTRRGGALRVTVARVAGPVKAGPACAPGAEPGDVVVTLQLPAGADDVGSTVVVTCAPA